jgi:predicted small metal-binding protein
MAEYRVECACGAVLKADDQGKLITKVKAHGKEVHDLDMTDEQIKEMIKTEAG